MLATSNEAREQPGGNAIPLRAALALLEPEKAREKATLAGSGRHQDGAVAGLTTTKLRITGAAAT